MRQPGHVTDAKGIASAFAVRGGNHQGRRNPGATGDADFRERGGQQKSGADGQEITAANQKFVEKTYQRGERRIILRERRAQAGCIRRHVSKWQALALTTMASRAPRQTARSGAEFPA